MKVLALVSCRAFTAGVLKLRRGVGRLFSGGSEEQPMCLGQIYGRVARRGEGYLCLKHLRLLARISSSFFDTQAASLHVLFSLI